MQTILFISPFKSWSISIKQFLQSQKHQILEIILTHNDTTNTITEIITSNNIDVIILSLWNKLFWSIQHHPQLRETPLILATRLKPEHLAIPDLYFQEYIELFQLNHQPTSNIIYAIESAIHKAKTHPRNNLAIELDNQNRIHAIAKPAVEIDQIKIYAIHGIIIPPKYGQLPPSNWTHNFFLEEPDQQLITLLASQLNIPPKQFDLKNLSAYYHTFKQANSSLTHRLDYQKITQNIEKAYQLSNKTLPKIIFLDSPYQLFQNPTFWLDNLDWSLDIYQTILTQIEYQLSTTLSSDIIPDWIKQLTTHLERQLKFSLETNWIKLLEMPFLSLRLELYILETNPIYNQTKWEILQHLFSEKNWVFPGEQTCWICQRPIEINFDHKHKLHALGTPALKFADNYQIYSYHGVTLPPLYGQTPLSNWPITWFTEQPDPNLLDTIADALNLTQTPKPLTPQHDLIESLTIGDDLIKNYHQTCHQISLNTQPIDIKSITQSINTAYQLVNKPQPKIILIEDPNHLFTQLKITKDNFNWIISIYNYLLKQFLIQLQNYPEITNLKYDPQWLRQLIQELEKTLKITFKPSWTKLLEIPFIITLFELCIKELKCLYHPHQWNIFQTLFQHKIWLFPGEKNCWICQRPITISLDPKDRLHCNGNPALQYQSGWKIYANHGITIPEKYGQQPTSNWSNEWFVTENDPQLMSVLYQQLKHKSSPINPDPNSLISYYNQASRQILLNTHPINHPTITNSITSAYQLAQKPLEQVIFVSSPAQLITNLPKNPPIFPWSNELYKNLSSHFEIQLQPKLENRLYRILEQNNIIRIFPRQILSHIKTSNPFQFGTLFIELPFIYTLFQYYISELNCIYHPLTWTIFTLLFSHGLWVYPTEQICWVCDRPTQISLNSDNLLHAEGQPALTYPDGYHLYSYRGVTIPDSYGQLHPHQWKSQWILTQPNAELRRILIQGIGYARLCQELSTTLIDSFQEYQLLKIEDNLKISREPIFLLKMTCPSTKSIHAIRVPPHLTTAREAITWVNHGIDPLEFLIQT